MHSACIAAAGAHDDLKRTSGGHTPSDFKQQTTHSPSEVPVVECGSSPHMQRLWKKAARQALAHSGPPAAGKDRAGSGHFLWTGRARELRQATLDGAGLQHQGKFKHYAPRKGQDALFVALQDVQEEEAEAPGLLSVGVEVLLLNLPHTLNVYNYHFGCVEHIETDDGTTRVWVKLPDHARILPIVVCAHAHAHSFDLEQTLFIHDIVCDDVHAEMDLFDCNELCVCRN